MNQKDQDKQLKVIRNSLDKCLPELQKAHASFSKQDAIRIARVALTELRKNPYLLQCDPTSFVGAVMQASQLGLEIGSHLGQAYLVPFGGQVQFMLGYRGMISLARRSGDLVSINAQPVYKNEVFELEYGINEKLRHVPCIDGSAPSDFLGAYAEVKLKGGGYQFTFVPAHKINALRDSQLGKMKNNYSSPWKTAFEEMACKTAVRRLFKYLPISVDVQRAIGLDEAAERGEQYNNLVVEDDDLKSVTVEQTNKNKMSELFEDVPTTSEEVTTSEFMVDEGSKGV